MKPSSIQDIKFKGSIYTAPSRIAFGKPSATEGSRYGGARKGHELSELSERSH